MRVMKQKLILLLLSVTMPFCVMAAELGDDGLHKQSWMRDTFKDLREDLDEANSEGRLMILCHLTSGEKSVTELEDLISARQAAVSQQLSRLRTEGLVVPRREGKTIYYRLADEKAKRVLELVYDLFCKS